MKKQLLIALLVLLAIASSSWAGEIKLKKTFFGGWKYAIGLGSFHGVGMSGKSLREHMEGNDEAVAEMKTYKERKIEAALFGWPGGFLMGWAAADAVLDNWSSTDEVFLAIGIPLTIIATIAEVSATNHLKKAVSIYNGEEQALFFDLDLRKPSFASGGGLSLGLKYRF